MRLSKKEFVLQFPDHPASIELVRSGKVNITGKEKKADVIEFKKTRKPKRKTAKKAAAQTTESALEQLFLLHLKAEKLIMGLERVSI